MNHFSAFLKMLLKIPLLPFPWIILFRWKFLTLCPPSAHRNTYSGQCRSRSDYTEVQSDLDLHCPKKKPDIFCTPSILPRKKKSKYSNICGFSVWLKVPFYLYSAVQAWWNLQAGSKNKSFTFYICLLDSVDQRSDCTFCAVRSWSALSAGAR